MSAGVMYGCLLCAGRRYLNMTMWSPAHTIHISITDTAQRRGDFLQISPYLHRCKILTRGVNRERAESMRSMRYGPGIERGKNIVLLTRYI